MQKKSRRQRVTISNYTTLHLRLVPRETVNFVSLVTSAYYCCDRCLLRHKTSTDNLVDCHPGSGIHQNLGRGIWDFFPLCREREIMTTQIRVLAAKAI